VATINAKNPERLGRQRHLRSPAPHFVYGIKIEIILPETLNLPIGQLAPFCNGTLSDNLRRLRDQPALRAKISAGIHWNSHYRTTCAVCHQTIGQLAPFLSTGIGQLALFDLPRYRTTCAETIGQLAPFGCRLSDNLRRLGGQTIGQLAPNYRTTCAENLIFRRLTRTAASRLVLTTYIFKKELSKR
jgi:hypothetical protein